MAMIIAVVALGGLTLVLATLLVLANKKLAVYEDPRIDAVEEMLPHSNCGACGFTGCRLFAEALIQQQAQPAQCTVSGEEARQHIASYLNVPIGEIDKLVARLACAGGTNVARNRVNYNGPKTCQAAAQVSGGGKSCVWGCLGYGDCESVCQFDAIQMDSHSLPLVDGDQCTACGDCVTVCPKDLFSLQPVSHQLWVPCNNREAGDEILEHCEVACTACGRCALDAENGSIRMEHNLPVIDYSANNMTRTPILRCPTGAIVWIEQDGTATKGPLSKKIIRQQALRNTST